MSTSLKLSDDLVKDARHEADVADRSLTSQIEHWARIGRIVEKHLRHEDVLALKSAGDRVLAPPTRRALLAALQRIAVGDNLPELAARLKERRTVYQDAGDGRVERIQSDGTRTVGRFVDRRFIPDESERAARRR